MFPATAIKNGADRGGANIVVPSQFYKRCATLGVTCSNLKDLFGGQSRFRMSVASASPFGLSVPCASQTTSDQAVNFGMFNIFTVSFILQVTYTVIAFIAIVMVDLFSYRTWAKKSYSNQLVDFERSNATAISIGTWLTEIDLDIAFRQQLESKQASRVGMSAWGISSCTAHIRYGIQAFKALNWLPFLDSNFFDSEFRCI